MKKRDASKEGEGDTGGEKLTLSGAPSVPFNNPFAALKSHPAANMAIPSAADPKKTGNTKRVPAPARALIRMERKGHGGKEVTLVDQLGLSKKDLERWLKALKQALGCGGTVDGDSILLQGDHRERLKKVLEERGVKKIQMG